MSELFQHHGARWTLFALLADALLCFFAAPFVVSAIWDGVVASRVLHASPATLYTAATYAVAMPMLCSALGLYRRNSVPVSGSTVAVRAALALAVGGLVTYGTLAPLSIGVSDLGLVATTLAYTVIGLIFVRLMLLAAQHAFGPRRVLIVGLGDEAQSLATDLELNNCEVVGFYPTEADAPSYAGAHRVFSRTISLEQTVVRHKVDEIVVAAREQRGGSVPMEDLLACRIRGVRVMDLAAAYERTRTEVPTNSLKASWLVYGDGFVQGRARRLAKRTFDVVSSLILLILALPIMAITALAIRLESPGPIVYRQERVGLRGRPFMCLKFRSMRVDAEADGVPRWAARNDSRVTRVGAFIRKSRIDELPQLISVLRGEMSMVGPRPERPAFVAQLRKDIPFYDLRHSVKPGVTGWAQIRYRYGASTEDARRKHQFDLYYVKNNSLFLDLLVLVETVTVVLFREGAH